MNKSTICLLIFGCLSSLLIGQQSPTLLKDINSNSGQSGNPLDLIQIEDLAFFYANDGQHGYELWKTDGTTAGTQLVKDISEGTAHSLPKDYGTDYDKFYRASYKGQLYFLATTENRLELWTSDGSEAGTSRIKIVNDTDEVIAYKSGSFVVWENQFFFSAGKDLWTSDGSEEGTMIVQSFTADIQDLMGNASQLYFFKSRYSDPSNQQSTYFVEAFQSDGIEPAEKIATLANGSPGICGVSIQGQLLADKPNFNISNYCLSSSSHWYDGKVVGIINNTFHGFVSNAAVMQGNFYFGAPTPGMPWASSSLLVYDGNETTVVKDFEHNLLRPTKITALGEQIVFSCYDSIHGTEPWISDGTLAGTILLADINPDGGSKPDEFVNIDQELFFTAFGLHDEGEEKQHGIWKTDGIQTSSITTFEGFSDPEISNIMKVNGNLIYIARTSQYGLELWTIEEEVISGTTQVEYHTDLNLSPNPANEFLYIEELPFSKENYPIQIFDINGQLVYHENVDASLKKENHQINLSTLSTGIHFIHIQTENTIYRKKLIKL